MKWKDVIITLAALGAMAVVSLWAYRHVTRPPQDLCRVCDRPLHGGVTYRLELRAGKEDACCPRCGMHYQIEHPGAVKKAWATDLSTGKFIPAESAFYVEGGDIEYCTRHATFLQHEPQGAKVREYDRCLPSLVAFRTAQEAEAYRSQHGGTVLSYQQAMERVKAL
ncbi:MAG: nitrous oxide reductase accessory protein NosL [Acidobacteriia bacterium]|nr:nitrous oxide reductase accessory protein NosL [Terriglobia bacterium]